MTRWRRSVPGGVGTGGGRGRAASLRRRVVAALTVGLVAVSVVAGCGGGHVIDDGSPTATDPAPTTTTAPPAVDTSPAVTTPGPPAESAPTQQPTPEPTPELTPEPTRIPERDPEPRTVTILGSGDVLLHDHLWRQAAADAEALGDAALTPGLDFGPIFQSVADEVSAADIAICGLETPLAEPDGPYDDWRRFNVPPQVASTLAAIGYDVCTTASNHTLDKGLDGVVRTLDTLDAAGIAHTGSARTAEEAATPLIVEAGTADAAGERVKVGIVAYTFSFNGLTRPAGQAWMANLIDVDDILAEAVAAKAAGADIVVVILHWGVEYDHLPSRAQRDQAAALLASDDVDLILGAHAHVVQPIERIDGKWVVYGMGNQVARHANPIDGTREGIMPVVRFTEGQDGSFAATDIRIVPTWMAFEPEFRLIDLPRALMFQDLPDEIRERYEGAVERITGYVTALGEEMPYALP